MLVELVIGATMIAITVITQAFVLDFIIHKVKILERSGTLLRLGALRKSITLSVVVLGVFCSLIAAMWLWAGLYIFLQVFSDVETALYFSIVSFTTVGFGDVVPSAEWRLLGSIESANGFLLFGWSTAFIFEVTAMIYRKESETSKFGSVANNS